MHRHLALAWSMIFAVASTACSSGGGTADGGAGSGGGADASDATPEPADTGGGLDLHEDCAAVGSVPPIVTIVDATTGSSICDSTFAVVGWPDAGPMPVGDGGPISCSATRLFGCLEATADAAAGSCTFALVGLAKGPVTSYDVKVSRLGYEPTTISVSSGVIGCVTPVAPSHTKVELRPIGRDASAESG